MTSILTSKKMSNLTELQAIVAKLREELGSTNQVVIRIAGLVNRSPATVWAWLSEGQTRPIPDNELELLRFKLLKTIKD